MEFIQTIKDTNNHKNKSLKIYLNLLQPRNKTRLCDSKIRTQDVHDKYEDRSLLH
jgi:hypothetical protein